MARLAARSSTVSLVPGGSGVFATPVQKSGKSKNGKGSGIAPYFLWFLQFVLFVGLAVAMATFNRADWPSIIDYPHNTVTMNMCGKVGAFVAFHTFSLFGLGAWVLLAMWGLYLFVSAFVTTVTHTWVRVLGALLTAIGVAGLHSLLLPQFGSLPPSLGGGVFGSWLADRFVGFLQVVGASLVMIVVIGAGLIVAIDVWVIIVPAWAFRKVKQHAPPVLQAGSVVAGSVGAGAVSTAAAAAQAGGDVGRGFFGWISSLVNAAGDATAKPRNKAEAASAIAAKGKRAAGKNSPGESIDEMAGGIGGTVAFNPENHTILDGNPLTDPLTNPFAKPVAKPVKVASPASLVPASKAVPAPFANHEDKDPDESAENGDNQSTPSNVDNSSSDDEPESDADSGKKSYNTDELRAKIAKLPLVFASKNKVAATEADLRDIQNTTNLEGYQFPGLDLLEEPDQTYPEKMESYVREQAGSLEKALREYRIDGEVVGIESGPVITLFEIRLKAGTKVAALSAVASDLARSLKAVNIRIVPNTQGRDTVGIEVPNLHKEKVRMKELMTRSESYAGMALPMFLGKDASGQPLIVDLATQPHMLIAGTTGSGKSVCMSSILMSFLYTKKPNELKLVLVDPKMVELSQFRDIPHLMCPVVTEMNKAAAILEWAVGKMEERYELLADAGCRDVQSYNALPWEELKERFNPRSEQEEARIPKKLPYMVFVIDELADLMMTNKEVEHSIVRMAQKARAVGMHLIVATQRPQANVVTGLIKANMPGRISFKVASGMDSRIVLDQKGGELLLGQGDMLYLSPKTSKLMRSQGTLVDDKEIRKVVRFLKDVAAPSFESQLLQIRTGSAVASGLGGDDDDAADGLNAHDGLLNAQSDPLFNKAVEIILETRKGSVSLLQRRLAIGYTRSSRLIDAMGQAGIVGDHKGTVEREVLITPEEWEAMKAQAEMDAAEASDSAAAQSLNSSPTSAPGTTGELFDAAQPTARSPQVQVPAQINRPRAQSTHAGDAPFDAN